MMAPKRVPKSSNPKFPKGKSEASSLRKINFKTNSSNNCTGNGRRPENQQSHLIHKEKESRKIHSLKLAQIEYNNVKQEKQKTKQTAQKKREEIKIALDKYKQKKKDKNRKLLSRTSKGQPIMKNRIEMLLEKIQAST